MNMRDSLKAEGVSKSAPSVLSGADPAGDKSSLMLATHSMMEMAKSKQEIGIENDNSVKGKSSNDLFQLKLCTKILIGSGHILNDLCASLWYSYLLLYLQNVVQFDSKDAAGLLLLGQIVDGVATPVIGYSTDNVRNCWLCRKNFGRCKSWHLLGSVIVASTFPFIFSECLGCNGETSWVKMIYYGMFIALFQIGWAMNQIAHLALIPKMNPDEIIRTELLAIRYSFNVLSNLTIFVMTWVAFLSTASSCDHISPKDAPKFRYIVLTAVGIGIICTLLFHVLVKEASDDAAQRALLKDKTSAHILRLSVGKDIIPVDFQSDDEPDNEKSKITLGTDKHRASDTSKTEKGSVEIPAVVLSSLRTNKNQESDNKSIEKKDLFKVFTVKDWLKNGQFYNVMCIYTFTRLCINVTLCYMPLYLQEDLLLPANTVATVPLTMYLSGLVVSFFIKYLNKKLGRLFSYFIGVALRVLASICILYLDWTQGGFLHQIGIYIVAGLLGGGASALLVTSLAIVADLIGTHFESGAFIYGCMSFAEKVACGLTVMLINTFQPTINEKDNSHHCTKTVQNTFYRYVIGYSCAVSAVVGLCAVLLRTYLLNIRKQKDTNK